MRMRWQRILRPALGLFALGFAVWVGAVDWQPQARRAARRRRSRTDPDAIVESTKGQTFLLKGADQDVRIDYERLFTYQSGRTRFFGAKITILGRAGRDFVITANEAEIAENQSQIDLRGTVVITTSDGLKVETGERDLHRERRRDAGPRPGPVQSRPDDRHQRRRQLRPAARRAVDARPGAHRRRPRRQGRRRRRRHRRGGRLRQARSLHPLRARACSMRRGAAADHADGAVVTLEAAADVVEQIELRGSSQVAGVGQGANGLEAMRSRDMNLGHGRRRPDAAAGDAGRRRVGAGGRRPNAPAQQLAGQAIDVELAADGQSVQGLSAQDDVQLDLPAASARRPDAADPRRARSTPTASRASPACRPRASADEVEFRESGAGQRRRSRRSSASSAPRPRDQAAVRPRQHRSRRRSPTACRSRTAPARRRGRRWSTTSPRARLRCRRRPGAPASSRSPTSASTSRPARSTGRSTAPHGRQDQRQERAEARRRPARRARKARQAARDARPPTSRSTSPRPR